MQQHILGAGQGQDYDWSKDHITVKTGRQLTEGRVTVVEDTLKPGFHLARHYHKLMAEIFYVLEGEITFKFDDQVVVATAGMTISIPPHIWHEVLTANGGKLITIFTPGGFDAYLEEMRGLTDAQFADAAFMTALAEKYDTWER